VILDYSWNHTGHTFWAWKDLVANQAESDYADWYWIDSYDDPATEANELSYHSWFGAPDLPYIRETVWVDPVERVEPFEGDIYSDAFKRHIFAVTRRWLDPNGDGDPSDGVDGFRLDVAAEMPLGFWREYRSFVRDVKPSAYLVGEVWWEKFPDDLLDPEPFLRGDAFDGVMNYRWYREARQYFADAPAPMSPSEFVARLASLTANLRGVTSRAMMNVTASHDTPRLSTSLFNKGRYKFKARASENPEYKIHRPDADTHAAQRLLLAHQFTYVGAPQIWSGDEMGMWGSDDPHTRKPLIWPELQFDREAEHPLGGARPPDRVRFDDELYGYYQKLIEIRKANPVLSHGELEFVLADDERGLLAYSRYDGDAEVIAVFNASVSEHTLLVPPKTNRDYVDVFAGNAVARDESSLELTLPGRTAAILVAH
jgi:glycosidase